MNSAMETLSRECLLTATFSWEAEEINTGFVKGHTYTLF